MELVARFCWCAMLQMLNWSIYLGMALAALLALRPMTRRFLEPRQRVALWGVVWLSFCLPQWINLLDWVPLPFTLRSFLTPRTYCDSGFDHFPMYLPEITGEGTYHLALPGGFSIPIQVSWPRARASSCVRTCPPALCSGARADMTSCFRES